MCANQVMNPFRKDVKGYILALKTENIIDFIDYNFYVSHVTHVVNEENSMDI